MEKITTEELQEMKEDEKDLVIVDVLGPEMFEEQHIPGAINIPFENIAEKALEKLDKDQRIVLYCKNKACTASPRAAEKLDKLGFEKVYDYEKGLEAWKKAGKEVES